MLVFSGFLSCLLCGMSLLGCLFSEFFWVKCNNFSRNPCDFPFLILELDLSINSILLGLKVIILCTSITISNVPFCLQILLFFFF